MILPGATLGMLGGGQLGRMFTVAAQNMGYRVVVLDPDLRSPAGRIADRHIRADFNDEAALDQMAAACDVVTTEFENIPASVLRYLSQRLPVHPSAEAVEITQNRIREKRFIRDIGLETTRFVAITGAGDIAEIEADFGFPAILKVAELGYDGKGQAPVNTIAELQAAHEALGGVACVLEQRVDLALEVSVILACEKAGGSVCFPAAENVHRNGILHQTVVPADISEALQQEAKRQAILIAKSLGYQGVLAVEFFVSRSGKLLINEIAPRTHNSGHYTGDACVTSQFEQQVRAICSVPFGDVKLVSPVAMINLLGDLWQGGDPDWLQLLSSPETKLHLYGKHEARPGRKMGHFNCLGASASDVRGHSEQLFKALD